MCLRMTNGEWCWFCQGKEYEKPELCGVFVNDKLHTLPNQTNWQTNIADKWQIFRNWIFSVVEKEIRKWMSTEVDKNWCYCRCCCVCRMGMFLGVKLVAVVVVDYGHQSWLHEYQCGNDCRDNEWMWQMNIELIIDNERADVSSTYSRGRVMS